MPEKVYNDGDTLGRRISRGMRRKTHLKMLAWEKRYLLLLPEDQEFFSSCEAAEFWDTSIKYARKILAELRAATLTKFTRRDGWSLTAIGKKRRGNQDDNEGDSTSFLWKRV